MQIEEKIEIARASGAIGLVTIWGITLNEIVAIFTIIYLIWQIIALTPKVVYTIKSMIGRK